MSVSNIVRETKLSRIDKTISNDHSYPLHPQTRPLAVELPSAIQKIEFKLPKLPCGCHDVRSGSFFAMPPFTRALCGAVKA